MVMVMVRKHYHGRLPRGMTLVELLMVVAIMTILLAVAIPMVRPAFRNRQLREASRQVNVFIAATKAVAVETGRPVGVWIERQWNVDNQVYATRLFTAEVPPSFSGAVMGSRAMVEFPSSVSFTPPIPDPNWPYEFDASVLGRLQFVLPDGVTADANTVGLLNNMISDLELFSIRFDFKGRYYACVRSGSDYLISIPNGVPPGTLMGMVSAEPGQPYEISRGPTKSIVNPLTLPGDTVLDLSVSGVGLGQYATALGYTSAVAPADPRPVIVLFHPSGQLGQVYVDGTPKTPTGPLYLLIGRRSKLATAATPYTEEASNLADPTNIWVTVNNRTGAITTDDNSVSSAAMTPIEKITAAREFARAARQKGGR